ncbi:Unknown protein [Striga hermonthica]|uniref:Retrotransposon Copia-like N-terminal domain-containing protein n=1 Tax=Striga hermonthica TaxID=68872 RepID=A0A9N7R0L4_STRHE|nr:Unknown protein [Striga hermonthica]
MGDSSQTGEGSSSTASSYKSISPYDITSSDNPGCVISQVLLTNTNYLEWSAALRRALWARKKFGFLDGSISKPQGGSSLLTDWYVNNFMLVSWIMNTIDASIRSSIPNIEIAQQLWPHIRDRFSVVNGTRIQQLKGELATTYQKGMTISAYYGKLRTLWDELYAYDRPVACRCGKCTCPLAAEHERRQDNEQCHQFLLNLDAEVFGAARSHILAQEPLPNLHRARRVLPDLLLLPASHAAFAGGRDMILPDASRWFLVLIAAGPVTILNNATNWSAIPDHLRLLPAVVQPLWVPVVVYLPLPVAVVVVAHHRCRPMPLALYPWVFRRIMSLRPVRLPRLRPLVFLLTNGPPC